MSLVDLVVADRTSKIGEELGVSGWITIDQKMIDDFANVTMDHQFIHVDPDRAKAETPFGATIAHGFLTLSLGSKFFMDAMDLLPGQTMGVNYGFEKIRFLAPVTVNSRLRGRFALKTIRKRSETEVLQEFVLTVDIENHKNPALIANWLALSIFAPQESKI